MKKRLTILVFALIGLLPLGAQAQTEITVTDADISAGDNVVWTSDHSYLLSGFVFVDDGATLTIEPGTVIRANPGQAESASALIVARGGKIFAEGTADAPIIFTSKGDLLDGNYPLDVSGDWGGVIILGRAPILAADVAPGEAGDQFRIEGIPESETRGIYGGTDPEDDSGIFRYVSIRHGGSVIGANNEINGLTLGGVGRPTEIDHVEVFANQDDGMEIFGGTVEPKYMAMIFNEDDSFDFDQGWAGNGQFWFALQSPDVGNSAAEQDGPEPDGRPEVPSSFPKIYNATYIGSGASSANAENNPGLMFRKNLGVKYYNSIFTDFFGVALRVESGLTVDSEERMAAGDLALQNNLWYGFGVGNTIAQFAPDYTSGSNTFSEQFLRDYLAAPANGNVVADPMLRGISRTGDGGLDPRPVAGSPALSSPLKDYPTGDFFTPVNYMGAFGASSNWLAGWTLLDEAGFISTAIEPVSDAVPTRFDLDQNYPNPFNPTTTIEFRLERTQEVRLAVYDVLGREVGLLVDGTQPAGQYRLQFEGAGLASGTYLYVLRTEGGSLVRSMSLVK